MVTHRNFYFIFVSKKWWRTDKFLTKPKTFFLYPHSFSHLLNDFYIISFPRVISSSSNIVKEYRGYFSVWKYKHNTSCLYNLLLLWSP